MAFHGSGGLTPFFGGSPMYRLRRELDRLFEDAEGSRGAGASWIPAVDVRENQQGLSVDVELPGIKPEDVSIDVDNGVLTISGERKTERKEGEEGRYHLVERTYGSFSRSFTLPQGVSDDQISADFENGILRIHIPKSAMPQPRRIQIGKSGTQAPGAQQPTTRSRSTRETGERPTDRMVAQEPTRE
jgi:HSP20 family protein